MNRLLIALVLFLSVGISSNAQNMGYWGKTNMIGIGLGVTNNTPMNKGILSAQFLLERSISVRSSIKGSFGLQNVSSGFDLQPVYLHRLQYDIADLLDPNIDMRFDETLTGQFEAQLVSFTVAWRNYALSRGAVAPFGAFYEFGTNWNIVDIVEINALAEGTYLREPVIVELGYVERMRTNLDFGFRFAIGEKRFIDDNQFLEYSVALTLDGFTEDRTSFTSHMQAAHYLVKKSHILNSFIHFNFIYGFGF